MTRRLAIIVSDNPIIFVNVTPAAYASYREQERGVVEIPFYKIFGVRGPRCAEPISQCAGTPLYVHAVLKFSPKVVSCVNGCTVNDF